MKARQQGFVLLTVLGLLIVLVLIASAAAISATRVREDQSREDAQLQAELDGHSTDQTLLYLLGSQRMTFAGLTVDDQLVLTPSEKAAVADGEPALSYTPVGNEIRLDGRSYRGLGQSEFAFQSDRGLVAIDWNRPLLQAWMQRQQLPQDQQVSLLAALDDYQDPDDLYRLNGAEAEQYTAKGLAPPPNRTLLTPLELRRVFGWNQALARLGDTAMLDTFTASRSAQICVNTAPARVLELIPGVTPALAQRVVDLRNAQAISSNAALYELLPMVDPESGLVSLHPGDSGTLTLWAASGSGARLVHWTLTPFDDGGRPWRIDYELRLPGRPERGRAPARTAQTPLLADPTAAHP